MSMMFNFFQQFLLKYLPNTLTELRLPNVKLAHFVYDTGYFHQIDTMLPNLEVIKENII